MMNWVTIVMNLLIKANQIDRVNNFLHYFQMYIAIFYTQKRIKK